MKVKLYELIGIKSGMDHYIGSFSDLLINHNIEAEIKSNYEISGRKFFPYIFVGNPVKKLLLYMVALFKYTFDILMNLKKNEFAVLSSYGHILDLPFLYVSIYKKNIIVDIHEVVSLDNKSVFVYKLLKYFYSHTNCKVISHSKKTDTVLKEFIYKNKAIKVPLFNYHLDKHIDMDKVDKNIIDIIENHRRYVLFFGNIRPSKGIFELLGALKKLGDNNVALEYKIVIAGQDNAGLMNDFLNDESIYLNTYFLVKYVNKDETNFLFENCRFVMVPYKDISQSAILEMAFAFEKPLISSKIPYFIDIFNSTPSFGYSINTENIDEFADALIDIPRMDINKTFYNETDIKKYKKEEDFEKFVNELRNL